MQEGKLTPINEIGEFGLIEKLSKNILTQNPETILGIGDDAAILENKAELQTLVSSDMLVEGVHFDMVYTPLKHLGYKAITVNLSDIAAMNGTPKQVLVSIAVSSKFTVEAIEELYKGMISACKKYKIDLIGGDTTASPAGLMLSITVLGEAKADEIVRRSGAKENDLICVSGDLGAAFVGLNILEREKQVFRENPDIQPDLGTNAYPIKRQLKPEARTDMKKLFEALKIKPTSMIDISDGLASEIFHICKNSNVGCKLYEEKFPIDPTVYQLARDFNYDPSVCVLNGGEDYELLFTIQQKDYEAVKNHPDITVIGHICDKSEGKALITNSNNQYDLKAQGWNAFEK